MTTETILSVKLLEISQNDFKMKDRISERRDETVWGSSHVCSVTQVCPTLLKAKEIR